MMSLQAKSPSLRRSMQPRKAFNFRGREFGMNQTQSNFVSSQPSLTTGANDTTKMTTPAPPTPHAESMILPMENADVQSELIDEVN